MHKRLRGKGRADVRVSCRPPQHTCRVREVVAVVLALLLAGCSAGQDAASPQNPDRTGIAATSSTSVPPSTSASGGTCEKAPSASSPSQFDSNNGTYAAQDVALDAKTPALTFNVIQWLTGDEARAAWRSAHPDDHSGPPNDYYIVDESPRRRTAEVSSDVSVFLTHLGTDDTADVEPDDLARLKAKIEGGSTSDMYWLTFSSGVITDICEQYRP